MRVMVTIQHPGHVHFFKHAIHELEARNHEVFVFARENEVTGDLLDIYGIDYELLAGASESLVSLAAVQAAYEFRLLRRARSIDPDVVTAIGGVAAAHVSTVTRARSVVFYDTEHARLITGLAYPFADVICTPACYQKDHGAKQLRYQGYHELAYLHPDRFTPDQTIREAIGLDQTDRLAVCRFSSWDSSHDIGQGGFEDVLDVVTALDEKDATVIVSSEIDLPPALDVHTMPVAPHRMHDLLAAADVVVSEGATTAAEAAVLGTPAVYVNSLRMGYTDELDDRYGLLFSCNDENRHREGLTLATSLLESSTDELWDQRLQRLRSETVDVTDVIVSTIETAARTEVPRSKPLEVPTES